MSQIVKRKYSNKAPEINIFNSWRHQTLLLVANQVQDSTFLKKINSKDIGISKLVPSLSELKDNGTVVQLLQTPLLKI